MRLWSLNPEYLDSSGLVALWREALLAQKVIKGNTRGYKNHPQLLRFKRHSNPGLAINHYLYHIYQEAENRNFNFNLSKIEQLSKVRKFNKLLIIDKIPITTGQMFYEFQHLKNKLKKRDPDLLRVITKIKIPKLHPLFISIEGNIADWEKI